MVIIIVDKSYGYFKRFEICCPHILHTYLCLQEWSRVFHDEIKFYILSQNLHQTCSDDSKNGPCPKSEIVGQRSAK